MVLMLSVGEVMGMGRSSGDKEEVKSSLSESEAVDPQAKLPGESGTKAIKVPVVKPTADKVIVTVNGVRIMQSEVDKLLKPQLDQMKAMGRQIPMAMMQQARQRVAERLVVEQLLEGKVKAAQIEVTDADIEAKIKDITKQQNMTIED